MPSAFAHAAAATAIGSLLGLSVHQWRLLLLGVTCAILPDLDSIGYLLGIPYEHPLGHRGLSHSLPFAAVMSSIILAVWLQDGGSVERRRLWWFLFLTTASHGVLDAMTNGGLGVAFLAPFNSERYFLPFRPIEVSPLEPHKFLSLRGIAILATEFVWVGLPCLGVILWSQWRRRMRVAPAPGQVSS